MESWQIVLGIFLIGCMASQGLAAPAESIIILQTGVPAKDQTTHEPCIHLPCPALPFRQICTSIKTTYFEWHGQLCPGCDFCVIESSTAAPIVL